MKALVTGAGGFVGNHVVRALLAAGHDVRALVLAREPRTNLEGLDVEIAVGVVSSLRQVETAMRGVDAVFHLAAIYALWLRDPERMWDVNVNGTANVLAAAKSTGARVVHTSSIARFGGQGAGRRATEASAFRLGLTGDRYSISKNAAHELAVRAASEGQDVVIAAPCGPIGPGDVAPTPTGKLLLACLSLPVVTVTPTKTNFIDVRDVALGHVRAFERGARGDVFLLGNRDLSLRELAKMALDVLGRDRPIVEVPSFAAHAAGALSLAMTHVTGRTPLVTPAAARIGDLGLAADASHAIAALSLPCTPIEDAVAASLAWFDAHGYLPARVPARAGRSFDRAARVAHAGWNSSDTPFMQ
jgi:dihydroflavonol-4-reductase